MSLRLVMMGTGTFALPTLLALYSTRHQVVGLFTQPDREGRGHHHHPHPMKEAALERETPVFQPEKVNLPESLEQIRSLNPDVCVVAAYGQILSRRLLEIPRLGAVNVHASLLPKYRGAAPVQYAVLNGEAETGITIFRIEPKLDAGPVLAVVKTAIGAKETAGELEDRLAELAIAPLMRVIDQLEAGVARPVSQDAGEVTLAPRLKKSDGAVDWSSPAERIDCHVRAMQPWPKAFTFLQRGATPLRLILLDVEPVGGESADAEVRATLQTPRNAPGAVLLADGRHLVVQSGSGPVEIRLLQPEGKRAMAAAEFLHGHSVNAGDRFGPHAASGDA